MTCRERVQAYLRNTHVAYETHVHEPAFTAQIVAEREHIPGQIMVKVVVVIADGAMVMLALPTARRVDLSRVRALLDAREVRLAGEGELARAFPDCDIGAMPPFGSLYDLPLYVDRSLAGDHAIYFQAGTHSVALSIDYADFVRLAAPTIAEFTYAHGRPHMEPALESREHGGW